MTKTATAAPKAATELHLTAVCPHCNFTLNHIPFKAGDLHKAIGDQRLEGVEEPADGSRRFQCDDCGRRFTVAAALVNDIQHACLVLLGEAGDDDGIARDAAAAIAARRDRRAAAMAARQDRLAAARRDLR